MKRRFNIDSLQEALLDAALAPEDWRPALGRILDRFGAMACDLYLLRRDELIFSAGAGVDVSMPEYIDRFLDREPRSLELRQLRAGEVTTDRRLATPRILKSHDYYAEFLPRFGLSGCIAGIPLKSGAFRSYMGIHFSLKKWEFEESELSLVSRLQPLLARALKLQLRTGGNQFASALREEALDRLPHGVIALDARGRICLANALARTAIADRAIFQVRHGRLACVDAANQARFENCVSHAIKRRGNMGGALLVGYANTRYSLYVTPARVESRDEGTAFVFIFIARLETPDLQPAGVQLRELFSLSPAESRLAAHLLRGNSLKSAADTFGLTYESVRFSLKQIFSKVGVHTQAELVAILSRAVHQVSAGAPRDDAAST